MKGERVIIPSALRLDVLDKIHAGHQGIQKCREREREREREQRVEFGGQASASKLKISLENVQNASRQVNRAEPMIPSKLPECPWQKVATDLFDWKGRSLFLLQ